MKKLFAIALATVLAFGLFACGNADEPADATIDANSTVSTQTETIPAETETDITISTEIDPTTPTDISDNANSTGTDITATVSTASGNQTTEPAVALNTASILALYTNATKKAIAANKTVTKVTETTIKRPVDSDEALAKLLAISIAGFHVESKVLEFLGEGKSTYTQPAKSALQQSTLTVNDITKATATTDAKGNTVIVLDVKGGANPQKYGKSPIGRFTWDYTNEESAREGIASAEGDVPGLSINIKTIGVDYSNIQIKATIDKNGNFTALKHSYNYSFNVEDIVVKELFITLGTGKYARSTAVGSITYSF
ncbi:MAG: hypothetical protein LBB67_02590 [Oscillospiraceae bacterium]|jgi:hypothetical protein|nr:hypothetical protein [Oscillospiraceae bacterium]